MKVRNNYNECLTNLACSIRKYFGLDYKHNTIDYIDKILDEYQPKNVITFLFDGMGANIIDRLLDEDDFLIKNRIKPITTVFPATTVAATTSMITGLNPVETGMLGWDTYYKELDKTITTFMHTEKGKEDVFLPEAQAYNEKYMIRKSISSDINDAGIYKGYELFPFGPNSYSSIDDMFKKVEEYSNEDGKKYIYAYDDDPDHTMHRQGCDSDIVKSIIKDLSKRVEELSNKLNDTIIFVVADHGHLNIDNIFLDDYPEIVDCLKQNTAMEPRAVNFFIKDDKKEEFVKLFNENFKDYFDLYPMDEIIESKLFGDGEENVIYRDELGDYLAIAKSNKAIVYGGSEALVSHHAGYTDDEIYVPLIKIETKKN